MLNRKTVITAVNRLLAAEFPESVIHKNREPKEFIRPAFLIMSPTTRREDAARGLLKETLYLTITCFCETDSRGNCDADELADMQQRVIDLFRAGFFMAEDRAVKVTASSGGQDLDRAWVDVTCVYHVVRAEPEDIPLMQEIETKYKEG